MGPWKNRGGKNLKKKKKTKNGPRDAAKGGGQGRAHSAPRKLHKKRDSFFFFGVPLKKKKKTSGEGKEKGSGGGEGRKETQATFTSF